MSVYIPNIGEKDALKAIIMMQPIVLGLYKNQVQADGNTIFATLEELPTGGGRGYAPKELSNDIVEVAAAADKWLISINSAGKAEGQYAIDPQLWIFQDADVADGNTVRGIFGYTLMLPFDGGVIEIRVGDTVVGHTSAAQAVVTGVGLLSGSWAGGDAAGFVYLKTKTGAFQNDEEVWVSGAKVAVANTGATGDAHKNLKLVEALSEAIPIIELGQKIYYTPKLAMSTT